MNEKEPYPYTLHTNRELGLMLAGTKPFAAFEHARVEGFDKSDALANQDFETHVAKGAMSEHVRTFEHHRPNGSPFTIDRYFYALKGEEWRVEAYCLLLERLHNTGWCAHLEWLQGRLLGYTNEQNEYHLSRMRSKDKPGDD